MSKSFVVKTTAVIAALGVILSGVESFQQQAVAAPVQQIIASVSDYVYPANVQAALAHLNKIRAAAGLSQVELDPFLTKAAQNHAMYITYNSEFNHGETAGNKGFTGNSVRSRINSVGGEASFSSLNVGEGIHYASSDPVKAFTSLTNSPLHRLPNFDPNLLKVGIGVSGDNFVVDYALGFLSKELTVYPYAGQRDVPVSFYGPSEVNSPLEGTGLVTSGYVITLLVPKGSGLGVTQMIDSKGVSQSLISKNTGLSPTDFHDAWVIIPKKVLSPGETYTVTAAGKTWSFTTAGSPSGGGSVTPGSGSSGNNGPSNPSTPTTNFNANNIGVKINGQYVDVNPDAHSVNNNTFIPLRGVFEAMGASVQWNQAAKQVTITKGGTVVKLTVGSKVAYVNGAKKTLSTASFSKNGSTFVPLRFASEALGATVAWDQATWTANITTN